MLDTPTAYIAAKERKAIAVARQLDEEGEWDKNTIAVSCVKFDSMTGEKLEPEVCKFRLSDLYASRDFLAAETKRIAQMIADFEDAS